MPARGSRIALLVVGHEPAVRETYAMLFQRAGYIAQAAEISDGVGCIKAIAFSAIVMDHTLSKDERQSLVRVAHLLSPNIKAVAFHASAQDCGADLAMDSREGAEAILERVQSLFAGYSSIH
jgi:hypothetical protein